ncbi:molybdenum cofactor biosynthesis protein B [Paenalcaligenes niemegkensis]|uniref:molybdenum cofactor biosynthesis protein B n=1 Tax=Paenalcaligenes niemegkensis TaxID=2895469 RepID=UPI001EE7F2A0|nr:molybdenum cofactor biosynthesis protein B [Paenalcaligenes niemegkensis]MCQ9617193.1 molybdenum cofactor biosynthesis protein B [Paenalcaligenes niemegkensis]
MNKTPAKKVLNCAVLTVSDSRSSDTDTSGDYLRERLALAGHNCVASAIVANDIYKLRHQFSQWIADPHIHVIISNGGTGFARTKSTISAVRPLLDIEIPGFGELFRSLSYADIGSSSLQSDAVAGVANQHHIFCLPGSSGACKLAWEKILEAQLDSRHKPCNFAENCA